MFKNMLMYYAFQDVMDNSEDIGGGIAAIVGIIIGLVFLNKMLVYIEFALAPFAIFMLLGLIVLTFLIPEMKKRGVELYKIKMAYIANRIVGFCFGYILVSKCGFSLANLFLWISSSTESFIGMLIFWVLGAMAIIFDIILFPLFGPYFVQCAVWRKYFNYQNK